MTSKKLKFRTAYNTGIENYSEIHNDDGLTEQHHAETCDINKILAQFMETGILPTSTNKDPQYGDVSEHNFQVLTIRRRSKKYGRISRNGLS
jgi:transcription initiation factor IIE alpha subunit